MLVASLGQGKVGMGVPGEGWKLLRQRPGLCVPRPTSFLVARWGGGAQHEWLSLAVINCNNL